MAHRLSGATQRCLNPGFSERIGNSRRTGDGGHPRPATDPASAIRSTSLGRVVAPYEIGYIPIDRQGANLCFQLVSRRYERGAIILTSNQSLGAWGEVFGDPVIASAILDRLLHHSITVNIRGDSYRLKEKMKAGLLKSKSAAAAAAE